MLTITAGMIKAFEECPAKFDLIYNNHVEIPSNDEFAEKGKQLHALINYQLNKSDISKLLTVLDKPENADLKSMWQNFLSLNIDTCEESEFTFYVPLNEQIRLTGRTDAIRKTKNGYEILDWKTGKSSNIDAETNWQTIVYLYGIYNLFKHFGKIDNFEQLSLTYFFLKENISKTVTLNEKSYGSYLQKISDICTEIQNAKKIFAAETPKCSKCSYNIVCKRTYK
ncbi:MAG: PD-(D/E)XK nuclease family protein [Candidatus Gastranaerophilales bacterium]|nr:PD-(D/E)XK nuclease family protein [Candidatus Gastranaerophilales bacterium]